MSGIFKKLILCLLVFAFMFLLCSRGLSTLLIF